MFTKTLATLSLAALVLSSSLSPVMAGELAPIPAAVEISGPVAIPADNFLPTIQPGTVTPPPSTGNGSGYVLPRPAVISEDIRPDRTPGQATVGVGNDLGSDLVVEGNGGNVIPEPTKTTTGPVLVGVGNDLGSDLVVDGSGVNVVPEPGETVPTVPGTPNLDETIQSSVRPPVPDASNPDNLFAGDIGGGLGALAPAAGADFGALSPSAGGNAASTLGNEENITCMNAYLANGWSSPELQQRCGGEDNAS